MKAGDWARYSIGQHITGNKTLVDPIIAGYGRYANTSYVNLNITAVSGTNVTIAQGIHYMNGTKLSSSSVVDVSLGVADPNNPPLVIMQNFPNTLNGISNGTFLGVPRIFDTLFVKYGTSTSASTQRYNWDNSTGILLSELFFYSVDMGDSNNATFTYVMAIENTNLWHYVPPKSPATSKPGLGFAEIYASIGVAGAVALGVVAYARKRPRRAKGPAKRRY